MEVSGQLHCPGRFTRRERAPGTHWIGTCESYINVMKVCEPGYPHSLLYQHLATLIARLVGPERKAQVWQTWLLVTSNGQDPSELKS